MLIILNTSANNFLGFDSLGLFLIFFCFGSQFVCANVPGASLILTAFCVFSDLGLILHSNPLKCILCNSCTVILENGIPTHVYHTTLFSSIFHTPLFKCRDLDVSFGVYHRCL